MKKINAASALAFTSPRVRGKVASRSDAGEGDSPRVALAVNPPHPNPLPAGGERGFCSVASGGRH
jgi:DNA helicase-2/ATP-dependent DNA helicase PcrA